MDPSSSAIGRRERIEMVLTIAAFAVVVAVVTVSVVTSGARVGPSDADVPSVVGLPLRNARAVLQSEDQHISRVICRPCEGSTMGCVVGQSIDPSGGPGGCQSLVLVVNSRTKGLLVPRVVGLPVDEAIHAVESAGLSVSVEPVLAYEGTPDVVVEQEPPQFSIAPATATVSLALNQ